MQIHEMRDAGVLVIAVNGRLESDAAAALEDRLLALIQSGEHRFCIDCATLTYLNSTALRTFLVAAQRLAVVGGKMVISNLCTGTRQVFDAVGFGRIMTLVATRKEGLQILGAEAALS